MKSPLHFVHFHQQGHKVYFTCPFIFKIELFTVIYLYLLVKTMREKEIFIESKLVASINYVKSNSIL